MDKSESKYLLLSEVKSKKMELQSKIKDLINSFQDETGLSVNSICIEKIDTRHLKINTIERVSFIELDIKI